VNYAFILKNRITYQGCWFGEAVKYSWWCRQHH